MVFTPNTKAVNTAHGSVNQSDGERRHKRVVPSIDDQRVFAGILNVNPERKRLSVTIVGLSPNDIADDTFRLVSQDRLEFRLGHGRYDACHAVVFSTT